MPVYAKQYGRLGNNLFQKAAAIGYAMKHGLQYDLSDKVPWRQYHEAIKEASHQYQELLFDERMTCHNVILDGYWQSDRYFAHCREEVLKAFGYLWELKEGWCSIHVRRGDYLQYPDKHPVVTPTYLNQAVNMMLSKGCSKFIFFSDDVEWCMSYVQCGEWNDHVTVKYSTDKSEQEDLELMSCCEHNIISNSTFSWWGAWLNQNPNKVVISPSKDNWFGPGNAHLDTSDIIPGSWIQIKY